MKQPGFSTKVKRGSVTVRIRRVIPSPKYPDYFRFALDYHEDGKRQRPTFATLKEARKEAGSAADRLSRGDGKALTLTGDDRLNYVQAVATLYPHQVPLCLAAQEYAQAITLLRGKGSITEACRYYMATPGEDVKPVRTAAWVDDLIATRKNNHASKCHLND